MAIALVLAGAGIAAAASQEFEAQWGYGNGEIHLVAPVPPGSRCAGASLLVPVTASAVKTFKKMYATIGGFDQDVSFACKGAIYRGVNSCNVINARCARVN